MTVRTRRKLALWALGLAGVTLQFTPGLPTGCGRYLTSAAISSFDFCAVLNCEGSSFFDLCSENDVLVLVDCPDGVVGP